MSKKAIISPQDFFGHQLGADYKIARWDRIVEYFHHLAHASDCIQVTDMGPSTEGHPFLLTVITSAENLSELEDLRQINLQITDPRGQTEQAIKELVSRGKAVILQSMSLHATEIGGTQMAPELAYDLVSSSCPDIKRILDNVIFLMVPCFNPDGQIMVTDWYNKCLGTEYEGSMPPWLYHKYTGHDNNRDAFMQNIVESQYMGKLLLREWRPQAYQDHHHMGSYGARLFVAPYSDPIRPDADPLVWRELSWYGSHMAYKLEEEGKSGIMNGAQFPGWGHFGYHWITNHHNIAGMLTESASAKLATPLYIHPTQLTGSDGKTMPEYAPQTNFPNPWPGGWWRLRDIVEQMKISALALLDAAARNKDTVLWNAYNKALRQTERGSAAKPYAFVIPAEQHDPITARKLLQVLLNQGIEVHQAHESFTAQGKCFEANSIVVFLTQPKMGVVKALLGQTIYPKNYWTTTADGKPTVFDAAADTVAEYMGVNVEAIDKPFCGYFSVLTELPTPQVSISAGDFGLVFDGRVNDSFTLVNRLLASGVKVWRCHEPVAGLPAGAFWIDEADIGRAGTEALDMGAEFIGLHQEYQGKKTLVKSLRVGMYQRFWGGNADEGWTRLVLEQFGFAYKTIFDADIKGGKLRDSIDVLIIPSDNKQLLVDITKPDNSNPWTAVLAKRSHTFPPEYRSGLGDDGTKAIKEFVEAGGRLLAFNASSSFAIEACGLEVKNVLAGLDSKAFFTHGSTLKVDVDIDSQFGYGMPEQALVLHWDSPAFAITDTLTAENYQVVVSYPETNILQSGILVGEERIRSKAAMVVAKKGKGEVVLYGFGVQRRAQTHGTYKLLFNALIE